MKRKLRYTYFFLGNDQFLKFFENCKSIQPLTFFLKMNHFSSFSKTLKRFKFKQSFCQKERCFYFFVKKIIFQPFRNPQKSKPTTKTDSKNTSVKTPRWNLNKIKKEAQTVTIPQHLKNQVQTLRTQS